MTAIASNYINAPTRPCRFEKLRPGSFFTIVAEPKRGIHRSRDTDVYQKALDGFYSERVKDGAGCVLWPSDVVQPMKRAPYVKPQS